MNNFIETHIKEGVEFFKRISSNNVKSMQLPIYNIPNNQYDNALLFILEQVQSSQTVLVAHLEALDPSMKTKLNELM